ncbi:MAG TPA: hypothetical protein VNC50_20640 [Planctomycetia bacterium]|nr:hypothetical protein [Planctomycetia bacterium]
MTPSAERRLTAAQVILLAADDLVSAGATEFSEWELTVAAWLRDRTRFGLRGYQEHHPDHKRVMMEIMGQKPHNPIFLKFMEKVRPNFYKLTASGRNEASRLRTKPDQPVVREPKARSQSPAAAAKPQTGEELYEALEPYVIHETFVAWKDDPDEPHSWNTAQPFFGLRRGKPSEYGEKSQEIEKLAKQALDYCVQHDLDFLVPAVRVPGKKIRVTDLVGLRDFLQALRYRFEEHLEIPGAKRKAVKS